MKQSRKKIAIAFASIVVLTVVALCFDTVSQRFSEMATSILHRKQRSTNIVPEQLCGEWVQEGTQSHWIYYPDGTGSKVNRSEFEDDDEHNGNFEWSISDGEIRHVFRGRRGNQNIHKYYTVTAINSGSMKHKDGYGRTVSFSKVNH